MQELYMILFTTYLFVVYLHYHEYIFLILDSHLKQILEIRF